MDDRTFVRWVQRIARRRGVADPLEEAPEEIALEALSLLEWLEGEFVWWQHISLNTPASGLTVLQRLLLEKTSCFKWDKDGTWKYGSTYFVKGRRVHATSLGLAIALFACMRWPNLRCMFVCHEEKTRSAVVAQMAYGLDHFPERWRERWRLREDCLEYVHEFRGGRAELDVYSRWEPRLSGKTRDSARGLGRGGPIHYLQITEMHMWRYAELAWQALRLCVPDTGWIFAETTLDGPDTWAAEQFQEALQGRGAFLDGVFLPWYADPLKTIPPDDPRHERAMSVELEPEDVKSEAAIAESEWNPWPGRSLTAGQLAYRRFYRCQGSYDERVRQRNELPETPQDAAGRVRAPRWLPRYAVNQHLATCINPPPFRAPLIAECSVSIWHHDPDALVLGVYQEHDGGKQRIACVGIEPIAMVQVCELDGFADDPALVRGVAVVLQELGVLGRDVLIIADASRGFLEMVGAPQDDVRVDLQAPWRGQWQRLQPPTARLAWDFSTIRSRDNPQGVLWARKRPTGATSKAPGWPLTGSKIDTAMTRLKATFEDVDALTLHSQYLVDELAALEVSTKTDTIEGPAVRLSRALALANLALQDWQPVRPLNLSGLRSGRDRQTTQSGRPGLPGPPR